MTDPFWHEQQMIGAFDSNGNRVRVSWEDLMVDSSLLPIPPWLEEGGIVGEGQAMRAWTGWVAHQQSLRRGREQGDR